MRQALASPVPPPRKEPPPRKSRLDPFKNAIEDMLRADLDAPRRKRRSVNSIANTLAAEHGMTDISNSTVRDHVVGRRGKARRLTT